MDTNLTNAERTFKLDPTPANAAELERLKAKAKPMVRVKGDFGFCDCKVLGEFVRETKTGYSYRTAEGKVKTVKKTRKPTCAGMGPRTAHLVACTSCPDHVQTTRGPGFCIHNRARGEHCESCLSM